MIVESSSFSKEKDSPLYFGEEMEDGRLTSDYDTTTIVRFRDLVKKRTELGRPLTEEEMSEFENSK